MILIKPSFLTKLDHYLLVNFPLIWETRFHFTLYYSIIGFVFYFSLMWLLPIYIGSVPHFDSFIYFSFICWGISFIIWSFYIYLQFKRKRTGFDNNKSIFGLFFMYYCTSLLLSVIPFSFPLIFALKVQNIPNISYEVGRLENIKDDIDHNKTIDLAVINKKSDIKIMQNDTSQRDLNLVDSDDRRETLGKLIDSILYDFHSYLNLNIDDYIPILRFNSMLFDLGLLVIVLRFMERKYLWHTLFFSALLCPTFIALTYFIVEQINTNYYISSELLILLITAICLLVYLILIRRYSNYPQKSKFSAIISNSINFSFVIGVLMFVLIARKSLILIDLIDSLIILILLPSIIKSLINMSLIPEIK